jgi:hypothetical protein
MTRQEMVFNAAVRIYAAKDVNFDRAVRTAVKLWECSVEATDDDVEDAPDESGTPTLTMVERDLAYWKPVAKALGMRVSGWTYRSHATFIRLESGTAFACPGDVADAIRQLLRRKRGGHGRATVRGAVSAHRASLQGTRTRGHGLR